MNSKDLRNLTVSLLKGHTSVGDSVYNSRLTATPNTPAITVFFKSIEAQQQSATRIAFVESGVITIDAMVATSGNWADQLDDLLEEVKSILFNSKAWTDAVGRVASYQVSYFTADPKASEVSTAIGELSINIQSFNTFNPN